MKPFTPFVALFPIFLLLLSCKTQETQPLQSKVNPAGSGFNFEDSDPKAMMIADDVMESMGGRKSWDNTRYIQWNFFGRRTLTWDKKDSKCRIEIPGEQLILLVDLENQTGRASRDGKEYTSPDSITYYLQRAKEIWINDSYWLVMPFKLKDSGVKLKYEAIDTTADGRRAHVLELSFEKVGVTPENKYHVYVDFESKLVTQWDFYSKFEDEKPRFSMPWQDYKKYGNIMLSGDRGRAKLSDIAVFEKLDAKVFSEF